MRSTDNPSIKKSVEEEIVDILKNSQWPREYLFLAVRLVNSDYDTNTLMRLAKDQRVFHKLGYLAELTLKTVQGYKLPSEQDRLREIVSHYEPPTVLEHLVRNFPSDAVGIQKGRMTTLNRKWGVITSLNEQEIYRVLDIYAGAAVR